MTLQVLAKNKCPTVNRKRSTKALAEVGEILAPILAFSHIGVDMKPQLLLISRPVLAMINRFNK